MSQASRRMLCLLLALAAFVYICVRALRMTGGIDDGLFYYAARLIFTGRTPYDRNLTIAEWQRDGSPAGVAPYYAYSGFVNPPIIALFHLPTLLSPPVWAHHAVALVSLAALFITVFFLLKRASPKWTPEIRLMFVAYAFLLPAVVRTLAFGQSPLLVCAPLAGALYFLARKRDVPAGLLLGLSLAKFTLTLPFLAYVAYHRNSKATLSALGLFLGLNLLMTLPMGPLKMAHDYRALLTAESQPGRSYDPLSTDPKFGQDNMVSLKRLLVLVLGPNRPLVERTHTVLAVLGILALAWVVRPGGKAETTCPRPLEIAALTLAGMLFFYHRDYDMVVLLFVAYGLIEYGLDRPENRTPLWQATLIIGFVSTYIFSGAGLLKKLYELVRALELPSLWINNGLYLVVLYILTLILLWRDRAVREKIA